MSNVLTAKDAAIDMVRPYAIRGDDYDQFRAGMLGHGSNEYWASVGGYLAEKQYNTEHVVVSKLNGVKVEVVFKLKDIWQECLNGVQLRLI